MLFLTFILRAVFADDVLVDIAHRCLKGARASSSNSGKHKRLRDFTKY